MDLLKVESAKECYIDRIQGSLVGGAIGDAFGYPVEFLSLDNIFAKYGSSGITSYTLDPDSGKALISDDTQMTLFTATGILVADTMQNMKRTCAKPYSCVFSSYLNWMETQDIKTSAPLRISWLMDVKELYARRAPGNTCISALIGRTHKSDFGSVDNLINNSKGCGGVMRVAPVGLFYYPADIKTVNEYAAEIAAITHSHPLGYIPAAMLAHIVNRLVYGGCSNGEGLLSAVEESIATVSEMYNNTAFTAVLVSLINKAIRLASNAKSDAENIKELGEGWVAEEALAIAVYCSMKYQDDFTKAMIAAVNHDGDSDSTGAITGNILGAMIGYSAIPECWKKDLEIIDVILEVATDLCYGCRITEFGDSDDPAWVSKYVEMKSYTQR